MKNYRILCLVLCFLMIIKFFSMPVESSEITSTGNENILNVNSSHGLDAGVATLGNTELIENAQAAILYEANSETLMYVWNADAQMYPASMVKILTALIAVEQGNLADVVTVTESAVSSVPYDAVSAELQPGEQMSLEDLLYCMMVGSANDAAAVIAEHVGGSQSTFVQQMNEYAQALGCTGTQFVNVHGLHDEAQYTTARDVARILDAAMDNETFRGIFTTVSHTVVATDKSEDRELISSNSLMDASSRLYYDSRVIGGRTGVTEDGRRCLAAVAESNGMQLISVVMGAESVYEEDGYTAISVGGYQEASALFDAGFDGYRTAQILFENQTLKQWSVIDGDCDVVVGPQVSVSTVLPANVSASDLSFQYSQQELRAPIENGQVVSNVQIWYSNMCVAQADLFAMNSVQLASGSQIQEEPRKTDSVWPALLIVIFIVVAVLLAVYILIRIARRMRIMAAKNRSKKYRRSRRRSR